MVVREIIRPNRDIRVPIDMLLKLLIVLTCLGSITCAYLPSRLQAIEHPARVAPTDPQNTETFAKTGGRSWSIGSIRLPEEATPGEIFFADENNGFGYSTWNFQTLVFKTTDGGRRWEKTALIPDFFFTDIYFISATTGFAAGLNAGPSNLTELNGGAVLKTEDGGQTWTSLYASGLSAIQKLAFNEKGEGVAVGRRTDPENEWYALSLVLSTKNNGQTWTDTSEAINAVNREGDSNLMNALFSEAKGGFYLLSIKGAVYKDNLNGSWDLLAGLRDERAQTGTYNFGLLDDGSVWVAGGTISIEGKWGLISVAHPYSRTETYRLTGYFFSDAQFISNNEVVICGAKVASESFGGHDDLNNGVILYSADGGQNWSTVYESKISTHFTSMSKLTGTSFVFAGTNGEIVRLEATSN